MATPVRARSRIAPADLSYGCVDWFEYPPEDEWMSEARVMDAAEIAKDLRERLLRDARLNSPRNHIEIDVRNGVATLLGEVEDVASKRRALAVVASAAPVKKVVDRLSLRQAEWRTDGEIIDRIAKDLLKDPLLAECGIGRHIGPTLRALRPAVHPSWWIELSVEDGVVTLDGNVPTQTHKRLAGALAWWAPGTRNVINVLNVRAGAKDDDVEMVNGLRSVLERDARIDTSRLSASCNAAIVTLEGVVPSSAQRDAAELDAWLLLGIRDVINKIQTERGSPSG